MEQNCSISGNGKREKVMRTVKHLLSVTAIAACVLVLSPGTSHAQVVGGTGINPLTGQVYSYSTGYNPLVNQFGSSGVVINPITGQQTAVGVGQNPVTGTIYRTDVVRNPWNGSTVTYRQRYNPLLNQYRWRANYRGW
jgi:hypothetical protein